MSGEVLHTDRNDSLLQNKCDIPVHHFSLPQVLASTSLVYMMILGYDLLLLITMVDCVVFLSIWQNERWRHIVSNAISICVINLFRLCWLSCALLYLPESLLCSARLQRANWQGESLHCWKNLFLNSCLHYLTSLPFLRLNKSVNCLPQHTVHQPAHRVCAGDQVLKHVTL